MKLSISDRDKAYCLMRLGDFKKALQLIDRSIPRPMNHDPESYHYRALILDGLSKTQEALSAAQTAVSLSPGTPEYMENLGYLHYKAGNIHPASYYLDVALKLDPLLAVAYYHRSLLNSKLKRESQAAEDAKVAKTLGFLPAR